MIELAGEAEPAWSRPALIAVVVLTAALMLVDVTRSGYGNTYYAAGALAASRSWSALLTNAADLGGYVSLDKGPLPDWLMGLSGRVFGFGSFSVMVPNALYATATAVVLHDTVRRALGYAIAIVAALIFALTPVGVLVGRYNAPDALLALLLVCAAWSLTVAVQSGRLRALLLCATFLGLAFNTKMLEAYLVLPAFALAYVLAEQRSLRRRLGELALAAGLMLIVSLLWFASMMLIAPSARPYVGDSSENSWFQLILGGNGVERVTGSAGAFARKFDSNLTYLFSSHVAGQIAWLLPLALAGLLLGLGANWSSRRTEPAFGAYVLWGVWALVGCVVLSFSAGARHAYYTSVLAPAVAALAAGGLVVLARTARGSLRGAIALAIALVGCSLVSFAVLADSPDFLPALRWVVLAGGAVAAALVLATRLPASGGQATLAVALGAAAVAVLGGPASYSLATVARDHRGYDPTAGPSSGPHARARGGASAPLSFGPVQPEPEQLANSLTLFARYLLSHRGDARFLLAATDAKTADPIALATRQAVITVGGFTGSDPTPSIDQLERLISSGQLRYVLLDAARVMPASAAQRSRSTPTWVERHCLRVPSAAITDASASAAARSQAQISPKLALYDGCE